MADPDTGRLRRVPARRLPIEHALIAVWGLAALSSSGFAADNNTSDTSRPAPKAIPGHTSVAALGKPVLVSRADVESPLARVRSLQFDASSSSSESRVADPAFKAVLLTPRESTGRPVQPIVPVEELISGPA